MAKHHPAPRWCPSSFFFDRRVHVYRLPIDHGGQHLSGGHYEGQREYRWSTAEARGS